MAGIFRNTVNTKGEVILFKWIFCTSYFALYLNESLKHVSKRQVRDETVFLVGEDYFLQ